MKKLTVILLFLVSLLISCNQGMKQEDNANGAKVLEVVNGSSYTYLRVDHNGEEKWLATDLIGFEEGIVIYYEEGLEMKNFESKELQKTFETIFFVDKISLEPAGTEDPHAGMMGDQPQKPVIKKENIQVEQPEGGISIGELYANRKDFSGKIVKVRGQVTKVNTGIMNRNWVHMQDGTASGGNFDLTLTTNDKPQVGEVVTYSGTLNLEVDFGHGYFYEVIVEDAEPVAQL